MTRSEFLAYHLALKQNQPKETPKKESSRIEKIQPPTSRSNADTKKTIHPEIIQSIPIPLPPAPENSVPQQEPTQAEISPVEKTSPKKSPEELKKISEK